MPENNHSLFSLVLSILLCFSLQVCAQIHAFQHYTVDDGLPSSEVYFAMQDSKGFIWFATDAGVCRFDGYEFVTFDRSDGLTDNTVFQITEDKKGRIWFGTFNLQLCYFYEKKIHPYKFNDSITRNLSLNKGMNSFFVDSLSNIYIGFDTYGIFKIDTKGKVEQTIKLVDSVERRRAVLKIENGYVFGNLNNKKVGNNKSYYQISSVDSSFTHIAEEFVNKERKNLRSTVLPLNNDFLFFNLGGCFLYEKSKDTFLRKKIHIDLPENRIFSHIYDGSYIWCSFAKKGVFKCLLQNDSLIIVDRYLKNEAISTIYRDRTSGFWFQSLNNGVYYLPNDKISYYNYKNLSISSVEIDTVSGRKYVAFSNGDICELKTKGHNIIFELILKSKLKVVCLKYNYPSNHLILSSITEDYIERYYKQNRIILSDSLRLMGSKDIIINGDTVYRVNGSGFSVVIDDKETMNVKNIINGKLWGTSLLNYNNSILIGTKTGLKVYKDNIITPVFNNSEILNTSITCLARLNESVILVGTKSYGLVLLKDNKVYDVINKEDGLISNLIRKVLVESPGHFWIGSNKGLIKIEYDIDSKRLKIMNLTTKHGLQSDEITCLNLYKDVLYVGTSKGLTNFKINEIKKNNQPPVLIIKDFKVNNKSIDLSHKNEFSYKENFVKISYKGLNYKSLGDVLYRYRMMGVDTIWKTTYETELMFQTLPHGEFSFEIQAKNEDDVWAETLIIPFVIHKPFWWTWQFISISIIILLIVIYYAVTNREKKIIEKAFLNTRIVDLELKSLRSQINPHFIFNTLNSIQNAINSKDKKFASDYIAQFGKLIRLVLESSKKTTIKLSTEIEMLNLYVKLESFRFSEQFSYAITKEDSIDEDFCELPSMVIQPFVENAILYGLNPKKSENLFLKIHFCMINEDMLLCTIEDNGIGRMASGELNNNKMNINDESGLKITQTRLEHYSRETNNKFSIDFYDLNIEDNKSSGTRVEIVFVV